MQLLTKPLREKLEANGRYQAADPENHSLMDRHPVAKLFNPVGRGTWLLISIEPDDPDIAFGLCDLGYPELGFVSLSELKNYRSAVGLGIERDLHWAAEKTLRGYVYAANRDGFIKA